MKFLLSTLATLIVIPLIAQQPTEDLYIAESATLYSGFDNSLYLKNVGINIQGSVLADDLIYFLGDGADEQSIRNDGQFTIDNMTFLGNNEYLLLGEFACDIDMEGSVRLSIETGFLEANTITGESNDRIITGSAGTYIKSEHANVGTNNPFGGIGVELQSANQSLGNTTIYRRYTSIPIGDDNTASILRYYEIIPENDEDLDATARFYFYNYDLNGYSASELELFRLDDVTNEWSNAGGTLTTDTDYYYIEQSGIDSFSTWAIGPNSVVLPVKLVFFDAEAIDNTVVYTSWQTASEVNNSHFEVERSQNGLDFEYLGQVSGNGTTSQIQNYNLTDAQPYDGTSYYRLKQVDFNGQFEYSDIQQVFIERESGIVLYPNPASSQINVQIPGTIEANQYRVINLQGQVLQTGDLQNGAFSLDVSSLAKGAYLFELAIDNQQVKQIKFIKQ